MRLAWGRQADGRRLQVLAAGGAPAEPGFERGGAEQTAGDAGEDQREIAGAEDCGDEGEAGEDMRVGGVLAQRVGEILAVGDERADEAEDLADARRHGPMGIGLDGCDRGGGGVEHERNKNTKRGRCQGKFSGLGIFLAAPGWTAAYEERLSGLIITGPGHCWGCGTRGTLRDRANGSYLAVRSPLG